MDTFKVKIFNKSELVKVIYLEAYSKHSAHEKAFPIARFDLKISNPEIKVYDVKNYDY